MSKLKVNQDIGLLIIRVGVGLMFFFIHGLPKLMGGPAMWKDIGMTMGTLGITFVPVFWGFMSAMAEGIGGLLLALGIGTRIVAAFMAFNMFIATLHHLTSGDSLAVASHAIELGIVFIAFIFMGSGRFAVIPGR